MTKKLNKKWTSEELYQARQLYNKLVPIKIISQRLNRTPKAIYHKVIGYTKKRKHYNHLNGQWKGKHASKIAIHLWVKKRKVKPKYCEICHKKPPIDLANISQLYYRNINDYQWLCRTCHMKSDGRLKKLLQNAHNAKQKLYQRSKKRKKAC